MYAETHTYGTMKFKNFLLQENKLYFSQKVSDILSALQDLNDNTDTMGTKHLVSNAQNIVNQIRRVIHTHWPQSEQSNLLILQKCGVAIMKAIEEKDDLASVLKSCQENLDKLVGDAKMPINKITTPESE